jgi:hypothetical protein
MNQQITRRPMVALPCCSPNRRRPGIGRHDAIAVQDGLRVLGLAAVHLGARLLEVGALQDAGDGLASTAEADGQGATVQAFEEMRLLDFATFRSGYVRAGTWSVA